DVYTILPFVNVVVVVELSGATLLSMLEHSVGQAPQESGGFLQVSGLRFTYDPARPRGSRITRVVAGGATLDLTRTYTVALSDYLLRGGDGYVLTGARVKVGSESGPNLTDVVMKAIAEAQSIAPRVEGRISTP
ncbi:MAG: 5'-nucleotidase C-terminal domain-containing protein, partial [Candidatus Rokubacteria bacterium]|nr:5'-nucleotidase C-terminal domain-containing protein [Candidatus Rokubacteria bacterium]